MSIVIARDEVIQCIKKELELRGVADKEQVTLDLRQLLPELKLAMVDALLLHTRGNQAQAARMLGIHRGTLRSIYSQRSK